MRTAGQVADAPAFRQEVRALGQSPGRQYVILGAKRALDERPLSRSCDDSKSRRIPSCGPRADELPRRIRRITATCDRDCESVPPEVVFFFRGHVEMASREHRERCGGGLSPQSAARIGNLDNARRHVVDGSSRPPPARRIGASIDLPSTAATCGTTFDAWTGVLRTPRKY